MKFIGYANLLISALLFVICFVAFRAESGTLNPGVAYIQYFAVFMGLPTAGLFGLSGVAFLGNWSKKWRFQVLPVLYPIFLLTMPFDFPVIMALFTGLSAMLFLIRNRHDS